jgi:hypothetical protein
VRTDERLDLLDVAVPMCLLGCDALFEAGLIGVDDSGHVHVSSRCREAEDLMTVVRDLAGQTAHGWSTGRAPYFAWHVAHSFR